MRSFYFILACCIMAGCATQKRGSSRPPEPVASLRIEPPTPASPPAAQTDSRAWEVKYTYEPVYFDFDRYNIRADQTATLMAHAGRLVVPSNVVVTLEGHCDERGTIEYNLALGQRRADAVKAFLAKAGVDVTRLQTVSYGEDRPAAQGHIEAAWAKNRRVEFTGGP